MFPMDDPNKIHGFAYRRPESTKSKTHVQLARTDRMLAAVQQVTKGGETNLHAHRHLDGLWFVLRGRARFYSDETQVVGEFGPHEGVLVPRGVKYWFESASPEPLEILQVESSDIALRSEEELAADRVDYTERKRAPGAKRAADQ
jgi:mannose-6-phosphate isomerase-like protein (cupin superfamily)